MKENIGSIRINGSGIAAGGSYESVRINGAGKITGDLECAEFVINGSGEAEGRVLADKIQMSGSGKIGGDVKAEEIKVSGSGSFHGDVSCLSLSASGSADVRGSVRAQKVKISGMLSTGGDCSAERFESAGAFEVGGLLNAEDIDISLHWHVSTAKEIGGESIRVRLGSGGVVLNILSSIISHPAELRAELIEGSEIYLENTKASVVRGTNVTVGSGCEIGLVEYKGILNRRGGAVISEEKKIQ